MYEVEEPIHQSDLTQEYIQARKKWIIEGKRAEYLDNLADEARPKLIKILKDMPDRQEISTCFSLGEFWIKIKSRGVNKWGNIHSRWKDPDGTRRHFVSGSITNEMMAERLLSYMMKPEAAQIQRELADIHAKVSDIFDLIPDAAKTPPEEVLKLTDTELEVTNTIAKWWASLDQGEK